MSASDAPVRTAATSRRHFATALAAAAGAPLIARALPLAGEAAPGSAPAATPAPSPSPTPAPPPAALEPMMQLVKAKYGQHLTPEQMDGVRKSVERSILNADRMTMMPLANSDEPDVTYFAALQGAVGSR